MQAATQRFTPFSGLSAQRSLQAAPAMQPAAALTRSGETRHWWEQRSECATSRAATHCLRLWCSLAGLPRQFTVEARQMTRRESVEKRHKRIRSKVGQACTARRRRRRRSAAGRLAARRHATPCRFVQEWS